MFERIGGIVSRERKKGERKRGREPFFFSMPYAQAGAMAVDAELAGSASGAVVFSQFFWPAALQQVTGFLADGTWVPMAAVQFAAVTGALLAGWMAARAQE